MTVPGGTPTIIIRWRLDPIGHLVSDATVPDAPTRFDIIATTTGSDRDLRHDHPGIVISGQRIDELISSATAAGCSG